MRACYRPAEMAQSSERLIMYITLAGKVCYFTPTKNNDEVKIIIHIPTMPLRIRACDHSRCETSGFLSSLPRNPDIGHRGHKAIAGDHVETIDRVWDLMSGSMSDVCPRQNWKRVHVSTMVSKSLSTHVGDRAMRTIRVARFMVFLCPPE
jgi:hypothetical protein